MVRTYGGGAQVGPPSPDLHQSHKVKRERVPGTSPDACGRASTGTGLWGLSVLKAGREVRILADPPVSRFEMTQHHCFNRLSFGISSVPEHFQRHMSTILQGLESSLYPECATDATQVGKVLHQLE